MLLWLTIHDVRQEHQIALVNLALVTPPEHQDTNFQIGLVTCDFEHNASLLKHRLHRHRGNGNQPLLFLVGHSLSLSVGGSVGRLPTALPLGGIRGRGKVSHDRDLKR